MITEGAAGQVVHFFWGESRHNAVWDAVANSSIEAQQAAVVIVCGSCDATTRDVASARAFEDAGGTVQVISDAEFETESSRFANREEAVIDAVRTHRYLYVIADEEPLAIAVLLDRLFGTQFAPAVTRSLEPTCIRKTDFEEYLLVEGAGWSLTKQLRHQREVIVLPRYLDLPVLWIGDGAFQGLGVNTVHVSAPVSSIGARAFADCHQLSLISLPSSTINVLDEAFCRTSLKWVDLPEGVQTVGRRAFADIETLEQVSLPASLVAIADDAFDGTSSNLRFRVINGSYGHQWVQRRKLLHEVEFPHSCETKRFVSGNGIYRQIDSGLLELCCYAPRTENISGLDDEDFEQIDSQEQTTDDNQKAVIPAEVFGLTVVGIAADAFAVMPELETIVLPETIRWIGNQAFSRCPQISPADVEGLGEVISIADNAFAEGYETAQAAPQGTDDRTAYLTPRMVHAHIARESFSPIRVEGPDSPLTRSARVPLQIVPGGMFFFWTEDHGLGAEDPRGQTQQALDRGADLLVAPYHFSGLQGAPAKALISATPRDVYIEMNTLLRRQYSMPTVSITGSVGKTTTKEMVGTIVEQELYARVNEGNNNNVNYTGRVFSTLERNHEALIQETGASRPLAVETMGQILQPDAFLVTNIGTNHLADYNDDRMEILRDKLSLDKSLPDNGVVFLNYDDPLLRENALAHQVMSFGIESPDVDYRARNIVEQENAIVFDIEDGIRGETVPITLNMVGYHNVYSALGAYAVARWFGISSSAIVSGLAAFAPSGMRQNLTQLGDQTVLLDTFNASEESIVGSARSLGQVPITDGGRRIFVFGDLSNRGSLTEALHIEIGEGLSKLDNLDLVVGFGPDSSYATKVMEEAGKPVFHTEDIEELVAFLKQTVTSKDVLGFKASRRIRLEQAADALLGTSLSTSGTQRRFLPELETISYGGGMYKVLPGNRLGLLDGTQMGEHVVLPPSADGLPVDLLIEECFARSEIRTIEISQPVRTIGRFAFMRSRRLVRAILPPTLKIIERRAFGGCTNLRAAIVPAGTHTIGDLAFANCRRIISVYLPSTLVNIGEDLFEGANPELVVFCEKGSSTEQTVRDRWPDITIRPYLEGEQAKQLATSVDRQVMDGEGSRLIRRRGSRYLITREGRAFLSSSTPNARAVSIPPVVAGYPVEGLLYRSTAGKGVRSVELSAPIRVIGRAAFQDCTELSSIQLPQSLTAVGVEAFMGCTSLEEVVLPEGTESVGAQAFATCTGLRRVTLPASLREIGADIFKQCPSVQVAVTKGSLAEAHMRKHYRRLTTIVSPSEE